MASQSMTLLNLYCKVAEDTRLNVWQVSLMLFILMLWHKGGYQGQIKISRKQLMTGAHFGSISTYHKCITRLQELEYITYHPNYDSYKGSTIRVMG